MPGGSGQHSPGFDYSASGGYSNGGGNDGGVGVGARFGDVDQVGPGGHDGMAATVGIVSVASEGVEGGDGRDDFGLSQVPYYDIKKKDQSRGTCGAERPEDNRGI